MKKMIIAALVFFAASAQANVICDGKQNDYTIGYFLENGDQSVLMAHIVQDRRAVDGLKVSSTGLLIKKQTGQMKDGSEFELSYNRVTGEGSVAINGVIIDQVNCKKDSNIFR